MIINMNGAKAPETPSPVLQEKTVTPETLPTVIGPDEGYDGLSQVTVNPDPQLKAENIRSGKTIFGVQGAFVGEPTAGLDIASIGNIYGFKIPYIPIVGNYDVSSSQFIGEYIETDNTISPSKGYPNSPETSGSFQYGPSQIIGLAKTYSPSMGSYVPTGYYWAHIHRTIPEGDYVCNAKYMGADLGGYSWSGTLHYANAFLYLKCAMSSSANIGSTPSDQVYNQALKIELGDITLDVKNGLARVHIPEIELDVFVGSAHSNYKYFVVSLNIGGTYSVEVTV